MVVPRFTDVLTYTDAAGPGGHAALALFLGSEDTKPLQPAGFVSKGYQELVSGANLISVLQLHTVVVALLSLARFLHGRNLVLLVDNDAAAEALINGASNRDLVNRLIGVFWLLAGGFSLNI